MLTSLPHGHSLRVTPFLRVQDQVIIRARISINRVNGEIDNPSKNDQISRHAGISDYKKNINTKTQHTVTLLEMRYIYPLFPVNTKYFPSGDAKKFEKCFSSLPENSNNYKLDHAFFHASLSAVECLVSLAHINHRLSMYLYTNFKVIETCKPVEKRIALL